MNDEEFARQAFAAAFRSGSTGEPATLPDIEGLAFRGRRAARRRHTGFAAGTTALAGVVTAGVVTGPTLLGIGSDSPSQLVRSASGGAAPSAAPTVTASPSQSRPDLPKPSAGVACATPPSINWVAVVAPVLPAGVTATTTHAATCVEMPGSRSVQAVLALSQEAVALQVTVNTGSNLEAKLGGGVSSGPVKAGAGASASPQSTVSPTPNASTMTAVEAKKEAAIQSAAAGAKASPEVKSSPDVPPNAECAAVTPQENVCVTRLTKGPFLVTDVMLVRSGASPVVVDVVASNDLGGTASPVAAAVPDDAFVVSVAKAVAAQF
jgi:hypothetical protein